MEIVDHLKIFVEIAGDENRQIEARVLHAEPRVAQALILGVVLDLRLEHVAVRHLAAAFQFLRDGQDLLSLRLRQLCRCVLTLRDDEAEVMPNVRPVGRRG